MGDVRPYAHGLVRLLELWYASLAWYYVECAENSTTPECSDIFADALVAVEMGDAQRALIESVAVTVVYNLNRTLWLKRAFTCAKKAWSRYNMCVVPHQPFFERVGPGEFL